MSQISGLNNSVDAALGRTDNQFAAMSSEDFLNIMFTELQNQDPFQPNDSAALLEQLNSIRSIEADTQLIDQLEALVQENQLASSANLIGKQVSGLTAANDRVTGVVMSVLRQGDQIALELDNGLLVPVENVDAIVETTA